jgi:hypothetical protein
MLRREEDIHMRALATLAFLALVAACSSSHNGASSTTGGVGASTGGGSTSGSTGGSGSTTGGDAGANLIGPAGGTITGPDGVTVTIPAGALTSDTSISIAVAQAGDYAAIPSAYTDVTKVYAFLPHGLQFSSPVTISLPKPSNASNLVALHAEPNGSWSDAHATFGSAAVISASSFSFYTLATTASTCTVAFTGAVSGTADCSNPSGQFQFVVPSQGQNGPWSFGFGDPNGGFEIRGSDGVTFTGYTFYELTAQGRCGMLTTFGTGTESCSDVSVNAGVSGEGHGWAADWNYTQDAGPRQDGNVSITIDSLGPPSDGGNPNIVTYPSPHGSFSATLIGQSGANGTIEVNGTF